MKEKICTVLGIIGGTISAAFGGWDAALITLMIFMAIDYITGLVVAGVFHKSPKTDGGAVFPAYKNIVWIKRQGIRVQCQEFIQCGRVFGKRSAAAYVIVCCDRTQGL